MSERDEIERLTKLTARLRDYSPENRQHVVHEAADAIDALQERVRELEKYAQHTDPECNEMTQHCVCGLDTPLSAKEGGGT